MILVAGLAVEYGADPAWLFVAAFVDLELLGLGGVIWPDG